MLSAEQRREIDRAKEGLVEAAERMLNDSAILEIRPNDFGDSQLRNLIAIANETESPAVVTNYIKYQMGRDNHQRGWSHPGRGKSLGDSMIHEIENGSIMKALNDVNDGAELEGKQKQLARIELVRHFLGFSSRYLKYLNLQRGRR